MKNTLAILLICGLMLIESATAIPFGGQVSANGQIGPSQSLVAQSQDPDSPGTEKLPVDLISLIDSDTNSDEPQDVIVQTVEAPSKFHRRLISQHGGRIRAYSSYANSGYTRVKHVFENINALLVELPLSAVQELSADTASATTLKK